MGTPARSNVRRRPPYPGAPFELSVLAMEAAPREVGAGTGSSVALLRRAREAGVTTFDTVDVPNPSLAEALLARAFPQGDPELVVLTRAEPGPGPTSTLGPGPRSAVHRGLLPAASARRPGDAPARFRRLFEVDGPARSPSTPTDAGPSGQPFGRGDEPVVVRCGSIEEVLEAARRGRPCLVSGKFSLLHRSLPLRAAGAAGAAGLAWIARDPFAEGRLDGTRFGSATPFGPRAAPRSVRDLDAEFGPVERLGFLARPRRRSLAQAALHFVADRPWVACACIPMPPVERWEEILGYGDSLPLEESDLATIDRLPELVEATPTSVGVTR